MGWRRKLVERKSTLAEKCKLVTFVLNIMKLSIEHSKKSLGIGKKIKDKTPRNVGPADTTVHNRGDGPTVQLCGDSNVACNCGGKRRSAVQFRGLTAS